jgi:predicted amidohydrolase
MTYVSLRPPVRIKSMKIAAVQHDIVWENAAATIELLLPQVAAAAATSARLVVLSEMFSVGFTMNPEKVAEPHDGLSAAFLSEMATTHKIWICGSVPTRLPDADKARNRLHVFGPGGEHHHYDKIHPFSFAGEDKHYDGGTEFLTVDIEGMRTSFFVCYDLRFADEFWQRAPLTDCFIIPANWPEVRRHHWQSLLVSRAIENQAYIVGVNRVGEGDGLAYCGDSRIIDPLGEIIASGARTEALLVAEVNPETVEATRRRFRFMQDRRTHALKLSD